MSSKILYEEGDKFGHGDGIYVQVRQHRLMDVKELLVDTVMYYRVDLDDGTIVEERELLHLPGGFEVGHAREIRAGIAKFDELAKEHRQ